MSWPVSFCVHPCMRVSVCVCIKGFWSCRAECGSAMPSVSVSVFTVISGNSVIPSNPSLSKTLENITTIELIYARLKTRESWTHQRVTGWQTPDRGTAVEGKHKHAITHSSTVNKLIVVDPSHQSSMWDWVNVHVANSHNFKPQWCLLTFREAW